MAEFLDTTATSYHIERLLKTAEERIVLISPYLKLRPRIWELIKDAALRKITVQIVYGKKEECHDAARLRLVPGVQITFCQNVHAKCYLNETFGIITSLNLYDFSEAKNQEMGVLFQRVDDARLYQRTAEEAQRIIRISGASTRKNEASSVTLTEPVPEEAAAFYGKLTTAKLAAKLGVHTTQLFNKLVGRGYLELRGGNKHFITLRGRSIGGEFRMGKGPYFLWPDDLRV